MRKNNKFRLKITIFTDVKNCSIFAKACYRNEIYFSPIKMGRIYEDILPRNYEERHILLISGIPYIRY